METRRLAILLILSLLFPLAAPAAGRVASIDLCADQTAMVLLDRDRIAGLSRWSRDAGISAIALQAKGIPAFDGSAETVLMSGADTVLTDSYADRNTLRLLKKLGIRVVRVPAADSFGAMFDVLDSTARALGETDRANLLAASLRERLDRLKPGPVRPLAAYLRPDGGTAGAGTAVDAALVAAGYRDYSAEKGKKGWSSLNLEMLALDPPQVVVTSFFGASPPSLGGSFSRHPVVARLLATTPTVTVPGALWSCGGWPLVTAAETLAAAREKGTFGP